MLRQPVTIEGHTMKVTTTLGQWLRLVTTAHEHGWQPQGSYLMPKGQMVTAEHARRLATALAQANEKSQLSAVVQVLGERGEFNVYGQVQLSKEA